MQTILTWIFCMICNFCRAQPVPRYGVLITEIFADPAPSAGLPGGEFLEIKNTCNFSVTLDRWTITDGQSMATIPVHTVLKPDSLLILCSRGNQQDYARLGRTIGLSGFPSLDNGGDLIILRTADGQTMHAVNYTEAWYHNNLKSSGGWSLEMADARFPCMQEDNWSASLHPTGGTPGQNNSLGAIAPDLHGPVLLSTYAPDSTTIIALFNEPLDSMGASRAERYALNGSNDAVVSAQALAPLFTEVRLTLHEPLSEGMVYEISAGELSDCQGNLIQQQNSVTAALPSWPDPEMVCINEILFNPPANGYDFIELYNRSRFTINLQHLYIGNRNGMGSIANSVPLSKTPWQFYPGMHLTISENPGWILEHYQDTDSMQLIATPDLPSWPDDAGDIVIADKQGRILDAFSYKNDFHFPLLAIQEGVSLERIDPYANTQDAVNWHSAASDKGFATPTRKNSQYLKTGEVNATLIMEPSIFSPDGDGLDDLLTIRYRLPKPGSLCNISIHDASGRMVRNLVRNALCGTEGLFRWNGLDDKQRRLPMGIYHVQTVLLALDGKSKTHRQSVVIAYRQ